MKALSRLLTGAAIAAVAMAGSMPALADPSVGPAKGCVAPTANPGAPQPTWDNATPLFCSATNPSTNPAGNGTSSQGKGGSTTNSYNPTAGNQYGTAAGASTGSSDMSQDPHVVYQRPLGLTGIPFAFGATRADLDRLGRLVAVLVGLLAAAAIIAFIVGLILLAVGSRRRRTGRPIDWSHVVNRLAFRP